MSWEVSSPVTHGVDIKTLKCMHGRITIPNQLLDLEVWAIRNLF